MSIAIVEIEVRILSTMRITVSRQMPELVPSHWDLPINKTVIGAAWISRADGSCRIPIMIRRCTDADVPAIETIINEAAEIYRGAIPADCWHEPYMPRPALESEIAKGVDFWGWEEAGALVGVMGLQRVRDASLIRHAYV